MTTTPVTRNQILVGEDQNLIGEALGFDFFSGSRLEGSLGILKRLDLYANRAYGARVQVFGEPSGTGWKATVFGGYYSNKQGESQSSGANTFEASTEIAGLEYGLSIGKRKSESTLFYLTLASRGGDADIEIRQNQVLSERHKDDFDHYIASLGVVLGSGGYFKLELNANQIEWRGRDSAGAMIEDSALEGGFNIGLGYRWGAD